MRKVKATVLATLVHAASGGKAFFKMFSRGLLRMEKNQGKRTGIQQVTIKSALVLCLLGAATFTVSAQKAVVLDALSKHGIDAGVLDPGQLKQPEDYAFDLTFTSTAGGKQTVTMAKFDPSAPDADRWTVVSVDGKSPSKAEINTFKKSHSKPQPTSSRADDGSYKIDRESADYLLISYKQDAASTPKDAGFMKDCRCYLTINLKTKRAEQMQVINEKPVKINILNAEKFELTVKYNWNEQAKRYFTASEDLTMLAKFLGQSTSVETSSVYTNYSKK